MKKIFLIGGGGHCRSCIDVIESCTNQYEINGIFDLPEKLGEKIFGFQIIGSDEDIEKYIEDDHYFLITVGQIKSPSLRVNIFDRLKKIKGQYHHSDFTKSLCFKAF